MRRITALVPRVREVTLGTRTFRMGEMRLCDLAFIEQWLEDQWECPLEALRGSLGHSQHKDRMKALSSIWDATEAGPPTWGDSRGQKLIASANGIVTMFQVILKEHSKELVEGEWVHLEVTREESIRIAEETSNHPDGPGQYRKMLRDWQPVEAIEELSRLMGIHPQPKGKPCTWPEAVIQTCEAFSGWTIEHVMGLTMRQFSAVRTGGKSEEPGLPVQPRTNLKSLVASMKKSMGMKKEGE